MSTGRNHTLAMRLLGDDHQDNPFETMDDESYELAMSICRGLRSFARQIQPLIKGMSLVVTPDGQVRCAELVVIESVSNQAPNA